MAPDGRDLPARHGLAAAERAHADHRRAVADGFGPLVRMGSDILKAVLAINGGAAIATILFVTGILPSRPDLATALVAPLAFFGFGLVVAGAATGWSYLAHERALEARAGRALVPHAPYVEDNAASLAAEALAARYRRLALGAVFVGIASAVLGFSASGLLILVVAGR